MKFIIFVFLFVVSSNNNRFSEVIITPKAIMFKHDKSEAWTIQTLSRNFQVFDLFVIKGTADSIVEKNNIPFKYYTDTIMAIKFSPWSSTIFTDTLTLDDIDAYNIDRNLGLRDKIAMIAYMNRKSYPVIESFFAKTFTIGNQQISTSLDKPMNIIDYEDNRYLYYHNKNSIVCVTQSGQTLYSKNDYSWKFLNNQLYLYPNKDYIPRKTISAIQKGRTWYNTNWEKMRSEGKLYAVYTQSGIKWNRTGLNDSEKNLLSWFIKN